jgi:hypothetical protein
MLVEAAWSLAPLKAVRDQEHAWLAGAERDYRRFVAAWRERPPMKARPALKEGNA